MLDQDKFVDDVDIENSLCVDAQMDITEPTEIVQESFMCIFDKGTLDCVVCNEEANA